jgi:hypothetical protein
MEQLYYFVKNLVLQSGHDEKVIMMYIKIVDCEWVRMFDSPVQYIQAKMRFANVSQGYIFQQDYQVHSRGSDVRKMQVNRVFARSRLSKMRTAEYRIEIG